MALPNRALPRGAALETPGQHRIILFRTGDLRGYVTVLEVSIKPLRDVWQTWVVLGVVVGADPQQLAGRCDNSA